MTAGAKAVVGGAAGGISKVTSTGGTVVVTNASGPTVNLEVPSGQDGINQLTGDVTAGPGTGSQAATLAAVATAQTTGDGSHAPTIQIDAKGRVLSIINNLISITTAQISNLAATLASYATLASPTFTGTPAAPTATAGTNTTQLATTAFVTTAVAGGGTVSSVFTRTGAVVAASGDYTVAQVTGAAPLASPMFTGTPVAPTATAGTNTTQLATTAFVATSFAPIASPIFTGTPTAPTPTTSDNSTKIATTAFVKAQTAVTTALAAVVYAPGTTASYTPSTTTLTALDTTNLTTGSFIIPASGKIKITLAGGDVTSGSAIGVVAAGWLNHSGGTIVGYSQEIVGNQVAGSEPLPVCMVWVVTGLTPGNSLQLDLAMYQVGSTNAQFRCLTNSGGSNILGPAVLLVEAI
jgi:hypothetical protein